MQSLSFAQYFKLFVEQSFEPYEYQRKTSELVLSGKNLILSVPTGAGKTWAAVLPFLIAQIESRKEFPKKLIYNLPLRSLTNSIYSEVNSKLENHPLLAGKIAIQTGEYNDDPTFEKDLVFATIDQSLSGFLSFPLSLSKSQANINAGAWIGSYLVFDEFHLLDEKRAMATTLGTLKMLKGLSQFCIMTATMSDKLMKNLQAELQNTEIITLNDFPNDKDKIASLRPVKDKKMVTVCKEDLDANSVIKKHDKRTLVICNQVESAQRLYLDIESEKQKGKIPLTKVLCLHSRFFDKDRKKKEEQLKLLFGRGSNENAILVTTQVVEAGMDLSCQTLHTQISPINSFLQRAGRCARFDGEIGEIYVYDISRKETRTESQPEFLREEIHDKMQYLPYDAELCKDTLSVLRLIQTLDGEIPKKLVENVLDKKEQEIFAEMQARQFNLDAIKKSWGDCEKNNYRDIIRDIRSIEITLINNKLESEVTRFPFWRQSLEMFYGGFAGWLKKVKETLPPEEYWIDEGIWLIKELVENSVIDLDMGQKTDKVLAMANTKQPPFQVFANSKYFGYSPDFGMHIFEDKIDGRVSPLRKIKEKADKSLILKTDTFYQHNKALLGCFEKEFKEKLDFAFIRLSKFVGLPHIGRKDWERLIHLMIILHDYGKLNADWQTPMRKFQAQKCGLPVGTLHSEILAHTDFDYQSENDKALGLTTGINKRPQHSGVGAFEAYRLVEELYDDSSMTEAVAFAIARHHDPFNDKRADFNVPTENYQQMERLLIEFGFENELEKKGRKEILDAFGSWQARILYFFFVRILRLCDQKATDDWQKYYETKNQNGTDSHKALPILGSPT